jgi:hypothetical protein
VQLDDFIPLFRSARPTGLDVRHRLTALVVHAADGHYGDEEDHGSIISSLVAEALFAALCHAYDAL